ncbi:hypothetical protein [Nocardioides sp. B-3]|uniref:hypothetical protein n=1 Tax=Nocardioides sp. B-3 TaxID=2895565 RepID=UPI002152D060|nr:hypothetical protein [Nocardioides sp. B-3]UUZ57677.1 hypothetical protein LP418_14615 [Nocardioides sp. B-3]
MITLADLGSLHTEHGDAWAAPVTPVVFSSPHGDVVVGDGPVTLMGCVNLSRDSTYRESVATSPADAVRMGRIRVARGCRDHRPRCGVQQRAPPGSAPTSRSRPRCRPSRGWPSTRSCPSRPTSRAW